MPEKPIVSIVTPSYNMAAFLPETIESVLSQDYPRIEYLVMDGGSTDGTLDILRSYGDRIRYVSSQDLGAADAINRGCERSQGTIFGWLNADDVYLPGAVSAAVEAMLAEPEAPVVYGKAYWVDAQGRILSPYPTKPFDCGRLSFDCYVCQPAAFVRKSGFESAGMLDWTLQSAFDYDLWIRLSRLGRFAYRDQFWATSRMHLASKTLSNRSQMYAECFALLRRHYGYVPFQWVHSRCSFALDGRDQFYKQLQPSFTKYLLSLPYGCWHNRRQTARFAREWWSVMKAKSFTRRLDETWLGRALNGGAGKASR